VPKELNVALIGQKFMGKAHSHAWLSAPKFFDLPIRPRLKVACGKDEAALKEFAGRWGWEETATDWREVVHRDDIDIIDISTPTYLHHEIALEAARAGKHIFCEKPFTLTAEEARELCGAITGGGQIHYVNHNYRRCPAVMLAKQIIGEGKLGTLYHWRGCYLQSWIMDPNFPLTWHLEKEKAGSGPHGDLNSHSVDLAHFLVGEISAVTAMTRTFIKERPLPGAGAATFSQGSGLDGAKGKVTVEDAAFMLAEFENGALGSFEASRFATGRKNYNRFEIYGSEGAVVFNLERMNELQFFSNQDPDNAQGFRDILVTEPSHAYINNWWPPGHTIGYEHQFVHAVADFMKAIDSGDGIRPDFNDGLRVIEVLEAGLKSAQEGRRVEVEHSN